MKGALENERDHLPVARMDEDQVVGKKGSTMCKLHEGKKITIMTVLFCTTNGHREASKGASLGRALDRENSRGAQVKIK